MTRRSRLACVGACLLASLAAATAMGATIDRRTTFTFNTPVAVPGVTLPAGSYLFRVAGTDTHKVVQVLSSDGKIPYSMFFVLEAWRATPSADPELTFIETAADMPHAIRTWWHPGESIGYDFLYPREQARRLARGGNGTGRCRARPVCGTGSGTGTCPCRGIAEDREPGHGRGGDGDRAGGDGRGDAATREPEADVDAEGAP